MSILQRFAPGAIKPTVMEDYFGRKIAIDSSMCLYQFLIGIRTGEDQSYLKNDKGEVTSHIAGFLSNRTHVGSGYSTPLRV